MSSQRNSRSRSPSVSNRNRSPISHILPEDSARNMVRLNAWFNIQVMVRNRHKDNVLDQINEKRVQLGLRKVENDHGTLRERESSSQQDGGKSRKYYKKGKKSITKKRKYRKH